MMRNLKYLGKMFRPVIDYRRPPEFRIVVFFQISAEEDCLISNSDMNDNAKIVRRLVGNTGPGIERHGKKRCKLPEEQVKLLVRR